MSLRSTIVVFTVIFMHLGINPGQDRSSNNNGCVLIDGSRPPQFIEYETQSDSEITLRLRNNTNCAIVVETDDNYPTELKKLPQGGVRIESVLEPRDGVKLRLHYLVHNRRNGNLKRGYGWGDSVFIYEIPAGQSIIFHVPESHFRRRLDIAVPFGYSWEGKNSIGIGVGGVVHRAYFLFDDLPSLRKR